MDSISLANLRMLQFIATKLGSLREEVVFLGGSTTALFITDKAAPDVRYTFEKILGFGNRWYKAAIQHAKDHVIADNLKIKVVTAPYFLATYCHSLARFGHSCRFDIY